MNRGAAALLNEATRVRGLVVAIVSGRDVDDLASRTRANGAYIIGSHGLEIRDPGGVVVRDSPPLDCQPEDELRIPIEETGLRLERKKHAIALHWRGISESAAAPLAERFRAWAWSADLDIIEGRRVVEARCRGASKEDALRWLARAIGAARVIYAGDDLTDFGALQFAAERGRGVFIANGERIAPPGVTVVHSFPDLFRLIRKEVLV
jgi:alpha,alpha-trehalase